MLPLAGAMDSFNRFACQVRLLGTANEPIGCGFICGSRHVLSCTHVVKDCLDEAVTLGARVPVSFPIAPGHQATLRVRAFHPAEFARPGDALNPMRDLCLLELDDNSRFPIDAVTATALRNAPEDETRIFALGLGRLSTEDGDPSDDAGEVDIRGELGGYETPSRRRLYSGATELAVRRGCSGAGAFAAGGLVGMVVEKQERRTALIIPVEVLTGMWNFEMGAPGSQAAAVPTAQTEKFIKVNLVKPFEEFDRVDQVARFKLAFKENWELSAHALLCTIAGFDDDLPLSCRDRLRLEMRQFLDAQGFNFATFIPEEVRWPQRELFRVDEEFARMKSVLAFHSGCDEATPAAICEGLNDMLQPAAFYSEIDQRHWGKRHMLLLRHWGDFLKEISTVPGLPLKKPLIHFAIIQFDAGQAAPATGEPSERQRRFYDGVEADVNERGRNRRLTRIDMLNDFKLSYVQTWIAKVGGRLALSDEHIASLKQQASTNLPADPVRLRAIDGWVNRVSMSGGA